VECRDRRIEGTVNIYSRNVNTRHGYDSYKLQDYKKSRKLKAGSTIRAATDRAITRRALTAAWLNKEKEKSQGGTSGSASQPQSGNPGADNNKQAASNLLVGQLSDGTPCYWSENVRSYYRYNRKWKKKSVKATDVHLARSAATASAKRSSATRGHGSTTPKQRPAGHLKDGTLYFYSERQGKYFTYASDGSRRLLSTK
jgi:hypothetical protein